ncbi:AAA family ATPase [Providencia rettgeri]
MTTHGISQRELAAAVGISQPAISQLVNHHQWPKRDTAKVRERLGAFLTGKGISYEIAQENASADRHSTDATSNMTEDNEEKTMLLPKQSLTHAARKHFKLLLDPFAEHLVRSESDLFLPFEVESVKVSMYHTAVYGGMTAVTGESGAGKSTLRRMLIGQLSRGVHPDRDNGKKIKVIEPSVLEMEDNDIKGKTLKTASLLEAIMYTIAPNVRLKRTQEARHRQLHEELIKSSDAGYHHVLIIEEAHSLPLPTLKHLKRLRELENGGTRLLSILLIGQTELADKLSMRDARVREVAQRCDIIHLPPLTQYLTEFLTFKLALTQQPLEAFFTPDGIKEMQKKLTVRKEQRTTDGKGRETVVISNIYPLAVANFTIASLNVAAELGAPTVNADVVEEVFRRV